MINVKSAGEVEAVQLHMPMPGIFIMINEFASRYPSKELIDEALSRFYKAHLKTTAATRIDKWFSAAVLNSPKFVKSEYSTGSGLTVFLDGYLSDAVGKEMQYASNSWSRLIAELYLDEGNQFINRLRGSFVILIIDSRSKKAKLFTDRFGTRPVFMREDANGSIAIAPQVQFLAAIEPQLSALDSISAADFLLRGCFSSQSCLIAGIKRVPRASCIEIRVDGYSSMCYCSPRFDATAEVGDESSLLEEFDALLHKSTQRLLRVSDAPLLLLTGGRDSRVMLAALINAGASDIPTLTYTVEGATGDEVKVAKSIADYCNLPHETYEIKIADFHRSALKEVLASDGQVQMLDAPSDRWEYIGERYGSVFVGDQSIGRSRQSALNYDDTISDVFERVGLWDINHAALLKDWLSPAQASKISAGLTKRWEKISNSCGAQDMEQLEASLFLQERTIMMQMGYASRRLWSMEHARPLLDEDIVEFSSRVPVNLKTGKALFNKWLEWRNPKLSTFSYSTDTAVPWKPPQFLSLIRGNRNALDFIIHNLVEEPDARLEQLFDRNRLNKALIALFNGDPLPSLRGEWLYRLPGLWRYTPKHTEKVGAVRAALRLLNLSLYLKNPGRL